MSDSIDLDLIRTNGALLQSIIQRNVKLEKKAGNMVGLCPFHDENTPSFTVYDDGHFHCFGCGKHGTVFDWYMLRENIDFAAAKSRVASEAGFTRPEVQRVNGNHSGADGDILRTYDYHDARGQIVVQSIRTRSGSPRFRQRRPDGKGGWEWGGISDPPLYYEPDLRKAAIGSVVWICEGEKDADRLHEAGLIATTNIGGSANWKSRYAPLFEGQRVIVLEDNDEAGRKRSAAILQDLDQIAASVKVIRLPNLPDKGDVSDWLDSGHTFRELEDLARDAPDNPPPLPLLWFRDIGAVQTANDFVEGLFIGGSMAVIYGESNSGKTFFATDLALHVACGWEWNGRAVERGAVIYLAMEGAHGIRNRVAAFKEHYPACEGYDLPFVVVPVAVNLLDPAEDTDKVIASIQHVKKQIGEIPVRLVVADTLSRAIAGGNENAPDDMGALVTNGTRIQQETGAALWWIHHSGKDQAKGARGHSLLRAATDTEVEIVADEEGNRTARVTKQRELECEGEFSFRLKVVELATNHRGKPVTSCVVDYGTDEAPARPASNAGRKKGSGGDAQRALEVLTDLLATSGKSGFPGAPPDVVSVPDDWWREQFYQRAKPGATADARKHAFRRASDALVGSHVVGMASGRVWLARAE
jgi:hypothetical protein